MEGTQKICLDLSRGKFYQFFFSTARETRLQNKEKRKQRHRKKEKRKRVFLESTKEKQFPFSPQLLFMIFLLSVRRPQSPSGAYIGGGICFDFPSTLKLFAFMINYQIPLTFYIFYSWNIYPTRIFPSHHSPFNGNFRIFHDELLSTFYPQLSSPAALVLRSVKTYFEIERHFNIIKLHFPKATHNELIYTCGMNSSSVTLETEHSRLCNNFIMNGKMFSPNTYSPSGNFRFCHRKASSPLPEPTLNQWRKSGITFSSSALALRWKKIQIINK